jgi:diguanylate cyclase (GGDEF)-like protein
MQENKLFEALLDVIPFAAYAVDINTYEVIYANRLMTETMYAPRAENCWERIFGQEDKCSWCTIPQLEKRIAIYTNEKLIGSFFDEGTDTWFQSYDELVRWPDGRTVKYSISVDITEQKEIQASMIKTSAKLAIQGKKLKATNQKLKDLAQKDALTGIKNRGYFFECAKKLWEQPLNKDTNIYVAMADLDKFKNLNDTYGHKAGDEVLKLFTQTVLLSLDEEDLFGRIGGEEFVIIIKSAEEKIVLEKLDKIRSDVANLNIPYDNSIIKFSVSIGVEKKQLDNSIDATLDAADKKLYEAKSSGRNKIKFRTQP